MIALDNGDTLHGTFPAVHSKGEAFVPLLNALAFDAMTAHWEFAYGPAHLRSLAKTLRYPLLAINCYEKESGRLTVSKVAAMRTPAGAECSFWKSGQA